jgi:hypothetical protein
MTAETTALRRRPWVIAVAPFLDPHAWGALVYVQLGFPLGLAWFVGLTVGFAAGVPLTIVWVGFLLLALTLAGAWLAEGLERRLAMLLLGARVPERRAAPAAARGTVRGWAKSVFFGPALWKGLAFLALRFPLGLVGWVVSIVSLAVSTAFLLLPIAIATGHGHVDPWFWRIDTPLDALPLSLLGLLGLIATFHLHRGMGWLWARTAEWLLGAGSPRPEPAPSAPVEPLDALPA